MATWPSLPSSLPQPDPEAALLARAYRLILSWPCPLAASLIHAHARQSGSLRLFGQWRNPLTEKQAPTLARGNARECLDALIAQAEWRALLEHDPERKRKHALIVRRLTIWLARAILRETAG